ncbi:MAG: hypothetical protein ACFFG0_47960 [Candidatus Thorarchaeota archaeon]
MTKILLALLIIISVVDCNSDQENKSVNKKNGNHIKEKNSTKPEEINYQKGFSESKNKMSLYQVNLLGENCLMVVDGEIKSMGFLTSRFVEGKNKEIAEKKAIEMLRSELKNKIQNKAENPPVIIIEDSFPIDKVPEKITGGQLGLIWFPMKK